MCRGHNAQRVPTGGGGRTAYLLAPIPLPLPTLVGLTTWGEKAKTPPDGARPPLSVWRRGRVSNSPRLSSSPNPPTLFVVTGFVTLVFASPCSPQTCWNLL